MTNKILMLGATFLIFLASVGVMPAMAAGSITRDLPATYQPGSPFTVTLNVVVDGATYYAIDEIVPSGLTVTAASDGGDFTAQAGHVKWVVTSGAVNKALTYTVSVPATATGTKTISGGTYQLEGMSAPAAIAGDTQILQAGGAGVNRVLPATVYNGTTFTVTLNVVVGSATFYAIDEIVPSGLTVTSASDGGDFTAQAGHVKWVVTSGAVNKALTYTVSVPATATGTKTFGGTYQLEGMSAPAAITGDSSRTITVQAGVAAGAGNPRVYDEKKQPAIGSAALPSYKWDAQSYQGFWYDLKNGRWSETLSIGLAPGNALTTTIDHNKRTIPEKTLVYSSVKQAIQYKVNEKIANKTVENALDVNFNKVKTGAGYYAKVGWMGEEYVALNGQAKKLAKLVLEQGTASSDKRTLTVGDTWDMGDGYTLSAQAIDAKATPRQAWLVLSRGGTLIDNKVVNQGEVYTYVEKSIGGESDVPIFITYVDSVFAGATTDMVQLKYTWLVSKDVISVTGGDVFGVFKVKEASADKLVLWNEDSSVDLSVDSTVTLAGNFQFKVADDTDYLRFTPIKEITAPGTYEFRGTVHDQADPTYANLLKWDAQAFEGFWYDLKTGSSSETLEINGPISDPAKIKAINSASRIAEKTLVYQSNRQAIQYKVNEKVANKTVENALDVNFNKVKTGAGYYAKLGWMGEEYVALNGQAKKLAKLVLEQGTASSDKRTLTVGDTWDMGDGYTLNAQAIDAKATPRQAWLVLSRGGTLIDNKVVNQGEVYTYVEKSIGGESDVPIFITYVDSVFAGQTTDMVQLKYTWLVSKDVISVTGGDVFGVFKVKEASADKLVLWNEDSSVDLSVDSTVDLAAKMKFRVADDATNLRFYPMVERTITAEGVVVTPTGTVTATVTPTVTPLVNVTRPPVNVTVTETPVTAVNVTVTPKKTEPGFEAVFAIAGLLAVAFLVLRQRK